MTRLVQMSLSYGAGAAGLRAVALFLLFLAGPVAAQADAPSVPGLAAERGAAERAHLWRVGVWGAANVAAGTLLLATADGRAGRHALGVQAAAWGAVNTGIAAVGLLRAAPGTARPDTVLGLGDALRAEAHLADVLWLNLGLDAGYAAVGATLWIVAARGVSNPAAWRGHGQAVVLQGAALFALDAVVLAGASGRFEALTRLAGDVALVPATHGLTLVVGL